MSHEPRAPLQLWIGYPDDLLSGSARDACKAILNEREQAHWQRFKFDTHRRESVTTHALVRTALSHHRPVAPQAWRFRTNPHGKPAVDPDCGLRFNASNSVGLVVCLIAEAAEVGVDVEPANRAGAMLGVATEVFSAAERAQLAGLEDQKKLGRALSLWTLKEAYIKARGMGLALPLDKFSFLFAGPDAIRFEIDPSLNDDPEHWRFFVLDHQGHRIAGVVERPFTDHLEVLEARPASAQPVRLKECNVDWFPRIAP